MFAKKSKLSFFSISSAPICVFGKNSVELDVKTSKGFKVQRARCWDTLRQTQWLESFLFYPQFSQPIWVISTDDNKYKVLDGANRLQAVFDFKDNKVPVFGRFWADFNSQEKARFNSLPINCNRAGVDLIGDNPIEIDVIMIEIYLLSNPPSIAQEEQHLHDLRQELAELHKLLFAQRNG